MTSRIPLYLLLGMALLFACESLPPRDNPADPGSSAYDGLPVIRKAWIETHCQRCELTYCGLEVIAEIYDPEGISSLDSGWVDLDSLGHLRYLGSMLYDAARNRFFFAAEEYSKELPGRVDEYADHDFIVNFRDDYGHVTQTSTRIVRTILNGPDAIWPKYDNEVYIADTIDTKQPCFQWILFQVGYGFSYSVHCYVDPINRLVWDSLGIHGDCTSVCMDDSLLDYNDTRVNYSWTITVVDSGGNSATSQRWPFVVSI